MTTRYKPYDFATLWTELARDEGRKPQLYQDSLGIATIGIGRNLQRPISDAVIDLMFAEDVDLAEQILDKIEPRWRIADPARQRALLNMAFNLGETRLREFKEMWKAIGNAITTAGTDWWVQSAKEALDSKWAKQVGSRAQRIAEALRQGTRA